MRGAFEAFSVVCALSALSCGGETSDGGGGCGTGASCGGDVVGTWSITAMCATLAPAAIGGSSGLPAACQSAIADASRSITYQPSGATITFAAGGTYQQAGSVQMTFVAMYGAACLSALGVRTVSSSTCSQLSSPGGSTGGSSRSCIYMSGGCRCTFSEQSSFTGSGTYRVQGTQLYLDEGTSNATTGPYCVSAHGMSLSGTASQGTMSMELSR